MKNRIVLQVAQYGYMDIQSKVIKNTDNSSPVKAYATIVLNNNIAIHGFRIIDIGTDDNDAMFVAMPSNRNSDGKYYDMAFPTRSEVKEDIINSVIGNYVDNPSSLPVEKSPVDMKITVRLHKTKAYGDEVPAVGEIRLSDSFVISGIKIICRDGNIDYEMPKIKSKDGNYYDMAVPLNDRFNLFLEKIKAKKDGKEIEAFVKDITKEGYLKVEVNNIEETWISRASLDIDTFY